MADANTWYVVVRDAYARAMGMSVEQLLRIKDPNVAKAITKVIEQTVKYLVDEDRKAWNAARQPPAQNVSEMANRAWGELKTRSEKEAVLQRLIDGR